MDRAMLFLCSHVDQNPGQHLLLTWREMQEDWLSPLLGQTTSLFDSIGLKDQEKRVEKDHYGGYVDGFLDDGTIIELKFTQDLEMESKLQVLLYHCMWKLSNHTTPDHCVLYNYRTGQRMRLFLAHGCSHEAFFREVIRVCGLSHHDREFLQQIQNRPTV